MPKELAGVRPVLPDLKSREFYQRILVGGRSYLAEQRMVEPDDESKLIESSRRGSTEAFEALVSRHQKMIHALTFRMSGSEADAADLAQDAFVQAWRRLDGFRGDARFSSWLYRIAVNLCLNRHSSAAREARFKEAWAMESLVDSPSPDDTRVERVQEALMQLPAKQRAAVVLTTYDGMNHAEAARVLGCSETTVSWRVFAARAKLKRWLRDLSPGRAGKP